MEVTKLTLYAGLCTCLVSINFMMEVTAEKHLENPKCRTTKVEFDKTCEVCTRPEQDGECHPGYKCSDVEAENDAFSCYYTRIRGWDYYRNQYDFTAFKPANNLTSPLPLISAVGVYQRKQSDEPIGYPALKVRVNVPYILYGPGEQNEIPKSMRIVFSSVKAIDYRDVYYYANPITRLYRFESYSPTSYDIKQPKQVLFKCLTGLDICGEIRAYHIQLTTYAPDAGLYLELNFTATAYLNETDWYPVIATALLPNNTVYVVFSPRDTTGVSYEIFLVDKDGHQKTSVQNFVGSAEKYNCEFRRVEPGTYQAKLLVKYTKREKFVSTFQSAIFTIPGETSTSGSEPTQAPDLVILILAIAVSTVIAISLLFLLYCQRNKPWYCFSIHHQECKKKSFLLYMREAEKFVPCITHFLNNKLSSMEVLYDKDWEKDPTPPFDLFKVKVKQCSHLLILWSPSASKCVSSRSSIEVNPNSTVQDYFREAITYSKNLSTNTDLKIVVLYIPEYAGVRTVSETIGEHERFDITDSCKQLCKCLTGDKTDFNTVSENALQQQIEEVLKHLQEDKDEVIDEPGHDIQVSFKEDKGVEMKKIDHPCPVHPQNQPPNIPVSPFIRGEKERSLECPYHQDRGPPSRFTSAYNNYHPSMQYGSHNGYIPHSPTDNGYNHHSPTDNGYNHHSPTDNGYNHHSPTDNGYNPHSPTDNGYNPHSPTDNNGYNPHSPTDNGYNPHSPIDIGYNPHSPTDNGYNPHSPTDNGYNPHSPTDNGYNPHSPTDNGYNPHSPTDNGYNPHSPTDNGYNPHSPTDKNGYNPHLPTDNGYNPHSPTDHNGYNHMKIDDDIDNEDHSLCTEPLLNTDSDLGYESIRVNFEDKFLDLCSEVADTNTKPVHQGNILF